MPAPNQCAHGESLDIDCQRCHNEASEPIGYMPHVLRAAYHHAPHSLEPPKTKRCLLGFEFQAANDHWAQFNAFPQRPFKPHGLMIWDVHPQALISRCTIGLDMEIQVSCAPIPARFFSHWQSYAEIAKALEAGLEPPNWCSWDPIVPGFQTRLEFTMPKGVLSCVEVWERAQIAMWGESPEL